MDIRSQSFNGIASGDRCPDAPTRRPQTARRVAPVLVVGAGPAGLVAAITLARYGVPVTLIDKRAEPFGLSRALVVSTRSMEILRSWGLEDAMRAGAADVETKGWVTPTLTSGEGSTYPLGYPTAGEAALLSPTRPAWTPQDHTEPLLFEQLRTYPSATIRLGTQLVELHEHTDHIVATVRDTAHDQAEHIAASYVIGADGAHSSVRAAAGIAMDGPDDLAEFHRVEFRADLDRVVEGHRYGLNVITREGASGVLAPRGRGDRWGFAREWLPGQARLDGMNTDAVLELIRHGIGVPGVAIQLERMTSFRFAAQIAQTYGSMRTFLVGDAAHRMTPRGGTGMNTAIQDGFDLGWKLAWVLRGWAPASLLETYEDERRPVGEHNVARSARKDGANQSVAEALPWDLNGRIAHRWLQRGSRVMSSLDLIGEGFTLLASAREPQWSSAPQQLRSAAPLAVHSIDAEDADALGIPDRGAILVRPDARPVRTWVTFLPASEPVLHVPCNSELATSTA